MVSPKALQALNVVFGFIGDGFEAISIVSNLLAGVFYDVGAAWEGFKSKLKWGDAKDQAIADMEAMAKKAQEYYDRASNGATDFKSKGIAAIQEIGKLRIRKPRIPTKEQCHFCGANKTRSRIPSKVQGIGRRACCHQCAIKSSS